MSKEGPKRGAFFVYGREIFNRSVFSINNSQNVKFKKFNKGDFRKVRR
jgi:hypothetical protein